MSDSPNILIKIELLKFDASGGLIVNLDVTGHIIESFSFIQYEGLAPCSVKFRIIDYTWELSQYLNLYRFNLGEYLRVRFSFGYMDPIWTSLDGKPEPSMTPPFIATVYKFEPTFSKQGVEVEITCYSLALEKVLQTVYGTYAPPASVKTVSDLFIQTAKDFSINLSVDGQLDEVVITDSKGLIPDSKESGETGMDYLARLYKRYAPKINGKPTFARFNPFSGKGEGSFEIKPDGSQFIKRVYRYNGIDSRIIEFTPVITPIVTDKNTQGTQLSSVNMLTKERSIESTKKLNSTDVFKSEVNNSNSSVLASIASNLENSYFKQILTATIKIIADVSVFRGDLVQVEVYNKLNGTLIMANTYFVLGLEHSMEDGLLYTKMELSVAFIKPIISKLEQISNIESIAQEDEKQEDALKSIGDAFSKLIGFKT